MQLLIISDIHGNLEALKTTLAIAHDEVICLGDLVDYGPAPAECIDAIISASIPVVRGNHDNAVASGVDCGCGYTYKHLSVTTREYTKEKLTTQHMEYLAGLPMYIERRYGDKTIYFCHGSPRSMYEYILPQTPDEDVREMIKDIDADILVVGHSHIPFTRQIDDLTIINPGSVGQPRDKDMRASCVLFDTLAQSFHFIRCVYDIESVCSEIKMKMEHCDELTDILKRGY